MTQAGGSSVTHTQTLAKLVLIGLATVGMQAQQPGAPAATTPQVGAPAAAKPPQAAAPARNAGGFAPAMISLPLYGDAAIPNMKPGPDEEVGSDRGWVQKVSRPTLQVYLPAPSKATG